MTDQVKTPTATPAVTQDSTIAALRWLGARLKEASTYAGLSVLLVLAFHLSGTQAQLLAANITTIGEAIGAIILAVLAIIVPEGRKAIVLLFLSATLLFGGPLAARAQTTTTAASSALTSVETTIQNMQNAMNGLINFGSTLLTADLNDAIADAQANGNSTAVTCWQTIEKVQLVQIPSGAGIAYYKQRYLDLAAQYVTINQDCATVAPAYVKLFDQFIQQAQALNL